MAFSSKMKKTIMKEATKQRVLIGTSFELLPVCNFNCRMCYIRMDMEQVRQNGGLKTYEEWIELAKELREAGVLFLLLTGGEVFLYPHFRELYEALYDMGFVITINTNGTLINEEIVQWLKQRLPKCVSISLYGASDETYEALCGRKGMFTRVDRAAKLLMENGIRIEFKTILSPLNAHDLEACWTYVRNMGVFYETDPYAFPPSRKLVEEQIVRFTPEETAECRFVNNRLTQSGEDYVRNIVGYLIKYEETKNLPGNDLYGFTCGATRSSCWITWQGHMTPCAMLEAPYTLPFEQGFLPAWEELKRVCDEILMSSDCSHCDKREVCTTCPAANFAESGSFQKKSEYHCRMTEKTLEDMYRMVDEWGIDLQQIISRKEEKP